MKMYQILLFLLLSFCFSFAENRYSHSKSYITGEDGVIRMNINIIGHVKNPGNFLVYDGIDLFSAISLAGGYLTGANLKKIIIYKEDGTKEKINLHNILSTSSLHNKAITFKPNDTVYIEQKKIYSFFLSSNLPSILLSLINVAITLDRTD